jgi:hypothetical protein
MVEKEIPFTEDEAVTRCQAGDRDAFRFLVDRYQNVLYGTAILMTGMTSYFPFLINKKGLTLKARPFETRFSYRRMT